MFTIRYRHLRKFFIAKNYLIYVAVCVLIVFIIGVFCRWNNSAWTPPMCWLPVLNEYDSIQLDYLKANTISCGDDPTFVYVHGRKLCRNAINQNVSCNWVAFRRKPVSRIKPDSHVQMIGKPKLLKNCTEIEKEFVLVRCHDGIDYVYKNVFYFVPDWINRTKPKWSVIVIGLEGISRMSFRRELPLSQSVLMEMGALEFTGYASATDEPFGNWMTLLSSVSLSENCWFRNGEYLDECDMIWNEFNRNGYRTVFAEDDPIYSALRLFSWGFLWQPVDHYLHTGLQMAVSQASQENRCYGSVPSYKILFNYTKTFVEAAGTKPFFGVFLSSTWTRHDINLPHDFDTSLLKTLESINNKTFLFVVSDRGAKIPGYSSTHQGYWEERLPVLYVAIPKEFQRNFPVASDNARGNVDELLSTHDLRTTLVSLSTENPSEGIFRPFPRVRNCISAGIPPDSCPCQYFHRMDPKVDLHPISKYFIQTLNVKLNNYDCNKNITHEIYQIESAYHTVHVQEPGMTTHDILIAVKTSPTGTTYVGNVRCEICFDDFFIAGYIKAVHDNGTYVECTDGCSCPDRDLKPENWKKDFVTDDYRQ